MSRFSTGDRVRLKSNVFNFPGNLTGTVIGNGPSPNSYRVQQDDGTENCWYEPMIETIQKSYKGNK